MYTTYMVRFGPLPYLVPHSHYYVYILYYMCMVLSIMCVVLYVLYGASGRWVMTQVNLDPLSSPNSYQHAGVKESDCVYCALEQILYSC